MVPEFVAVLALLAMFGIICICVFTVLACCYECCCRDNGYKYQNVPLEEVVSDSLDDDQCSTHNWKQPSARDTIIEIHSEIKRTPSSFVCASCSGMITTTYYDKESSFCHNCRFEQYARIDLSIEEKREVTIRCSKASLDRDIYSHCKDVVITTLKKLLKHSGNGGRFSQKPDREGSTKSGLKTRKPVEFDFSVAVILQDTPTFLPKTDIENERKNCQWMDGKDTDKRKTHMGCAVIRLGPRDARRFKESCVKAELSPTKLRLYFKKFLLTAINYSNLDGVKVVVQTEMNGPAVRLVLEAKNLGISHHIDIDVTPKVILSSNVNPQRFAQGFEWPRNSTYQFLSKDDITRVEEQYLYFVPKSERYWCLSFANYENEVLQMFPNNSVEKKIIRCVKVKLESWQTQSKGKLNEISSYLLKEAFFWLREKMPDDSLWTSDQCAERYYNFVMELRFRFANGDLPSYFVPTINLLEGKEKSRALMVEYLDKELKKIC